MPRAAPCAFGAAAASAIPSGGSVASDPAEASGAAEEDSVGSGASAADGSAAAAPAGAGEEGRMRNAIAVMLLGTALSGCGYNQMVQLRETVDSAWAQVENQLQR